MSGRSFRLLFALLILWALLLPQTLLAADGLQKGLVAESVVTVAGPADDAPDVFIPIVRKPLASAAVTAKPEWSAGWWQWIERRGLGVAVLELGDVDCSLGQEGNVWFLAGHIDGTSQMAADTRGQPDIICCDDPPDPPPAEPVRRCSVPSSKTFVAPLFVMNWHNEGDEDLTIEEKRQWLDDIYSDKVPGALNSQFCGAIATIDGKEVPHQRLKSPPFPHLADAQTISDGFFVALRLTPGAHQVELSGRLCAFGTDSAIESLYVRYDLTVH